jgi:hypothetical protein
VLEYLSSLATEKAKSGSGYASKEAKPGKGSTYPSIGLGRSAKSAASPSTNFMVMKNLAFTSR